MASLVEYFQLVTTPIRSVLPRVSLPALASRPALPSSLAAPELDGMEVDVLSAVRRRRGSTRSALCRNYRCPPKAQSESLREPGCSKIRGPRDLSRPPRSPLNSVKVRAGSACPRWLAPYPATNLLCSTVPTCGTTKEAPQKKEALWTRPGMLWGVCMS